MSSKPFLYKSFIKLLVSGRSAPPRFLQWKSYNIFIIESLDIFFRKPSITFEILSFDYEPGAGGGKHDHLVHWMKTTLPVFLYLLVNAANLYNCKIPDIEPLLPEGVPPDPLK